VFPNKEKAMKKFLFTLLVLGMSSIALVGCKAEGEIDDNASTNISVAR
jgi:hypothetical protein